MALTPPTALRYRCAVAGVEGPEGDAVGGAGRDRTGDPLVANQVLSQLSYSPPFVVVGRRVMVGLSGFEPLTSRLSAVRSSQLSYRPVVPPTLTANPPRNNARLRKSSRPPGGGRVTR